MTDEEIQSIEPYYQEDEEGNYVLNTKDDDILEQMDNAFGMPMLILASMEESGEVDVEPDPSGRGRGNGESRGYDCQKG